jgi:hypothetical protein
MAKLRRVKFELPRTHGQLIRNELKANPASVSMKGNQYFYEVGLGYLRGYGAAFGFAFSCCC